MSTDVLGDRNNANVPRLPPSRRVVLLILALAPFTALVLLGSQLYFRHDDSALLLWAKEFQHPFYYAFSADPHTNGFADSPGMRAYWRPFPYLYTMLLWSIFGPVPGPYFVVGGLCFIGAVFFFFRLAERHAGTWSALFSCLVLLGAFGGSMHNLFHIPVAIGYLFQLAMIYCFWCYLRFGKRVHLVAILILLVPSISRQSTPALLVAVLAAMWLDHEGSPWTFVRRNLAAFALLPVAFWLVSLSPIATRGSVLQYGGDLTAAWAFVSERIHFYGDYLTGGLKGVLLLGLLGGTVVRSVGCALAKRTHWMVFRWTWPLVTALGIWALWGHTSASIIALLLACGYLIATDRSLRLPLLWAAASLSCFVVAFYYHEGYLLEAGFPLSLAAGIVLHRLWAAAAQWWSSGARANRWMWFAAAGCALLIALPLGARALRNGGPIETEILMIRTAIASNRTFSQLIHSMATELPPNAEVYEIGEDVLRVTRFDRRRLSRLDRARRVKVMSGEDTLVMLRVLDRSDIRIRAVPSDGSAAPPNGSYFILLNRFEMEFARRRFELTPVREFCDNDECAGMYQLQT